MKFESPTQSVEDRFANLAENVSSITGGHTEVSFEPWKKAMSIDVGEPTKVILRGPVDLTSQLLGGIDSLPKILDIHGPVAINVDMINSLYQDQSARIWSIDGPIKILGAEGISDEQKEEIKDKLATCNGVGITKEVEFA